MKFNKRQIKAIWICLSILIPTIYYLTKTIVPLSRDTARMKRELEAIYGGSAGKDNGEESISFLKDDINRVQGEVKRIMEISGLFIFELLSITGLLVYLGKEKRGEKALDTKT